MVREMQGAGRAGRECCGTPSPPYPYGIVVIDKNTTAGLPDRSIRGIRWRPGWTWDGPGMEMPMRLRGPFAICLALLAPLTLPSCFDSEERLYTAADLWHDLPDNYVRDIKAAPFFKHVELSLTYTGGGTFSATVDGTACPFGVAQPMDPAGDSAVGVAVFNLEADCHFNMAKHPWLVLAAQVYPPGHASHDKGVAFGVPGDSAKIVAFAEAKGVALDPYQTDGEDRYTVLSNAESFKAFLPSYIMQSGLADYGD